MSAPRNSQVSHPWSSTSLEDPGLRCSQSFNLWALSTRSPHWAGGTYCPEPTSLLNP